MYEKISEKSGGTLSDCSTETLPLTEIIALDDRIEDIAEILQKHYGLAELGDPSAESEVRV